MMYPGATRHLLVRNFSTNGMRARTLGLVLHVQAGNNDPYGWFNRVCDPSEAASSHFWVSKTGTVMQYVDTANRAWAQGNGNPDYLSVETEGYPKEPLTPAQITAVGALYAWGAKTFGWPNALAEKPGQPGLAWHGMGGTAWGNHPGCPGDLRKAQRGAILAAAFPKPKPPEPPKEEPLMFFITPYTEPGHQPAQWIVNPDGTARTWIHSADPKVPNMDVYKALVATGVYKVVALPPAFVATVPVVGDWPPAV